jgi:hypothetical protein
MMTPSHGPGFRLQAGAGPRRVLLRLVGVLAMAASIGIAVSGCALNASVPPPPLFNDIQPHGLLTCPPAPDAKAGTPTWSTIFGFALTTYNNQSRSAVTIESVSLIESHNLVLHGAIVYEMVRSKHPLSLDAPWDLERAGRSGSRMGGPADRSRGRDPARACQHCRRGRFSRPVSSRAGDLGEDSRRGMGHRRATSV